jgi:hypothetical protein
MSIPDGHLVRKAFLTKYGYPPDLTYEEIVSEFQKRYDCAQALRLIEGGSHRGMLVIEGMDESFAKGAVSLEREARQRKMEGLSEGTGYGITELDQMVEGYASRLETVWIQKL